MFLLPAVLLVRHAARPVPPLLTDEEAAAYRANQSVAPNSVRDGSHIDALLVPSNPAMLVPPEMALAARTPPGTRLRGDGR